jgi:hypothetical protein
VLKKAGIVVATAAAGLLALSPLAFAGDDHDKGSKKVENTNEVENSNEGDEQNGLVNVQDVNLQACDVLSLNAAVGGVLALVGETDPNAIDFTECNAETGDEVDQEIDQEIED